MTGGGSGHLPLFLGYVGDGMIDGCGVGGVFQSPSTEHRSMDITPEVEAGAGVLYLYGNWLYWRYRRPAIWLLTSAIWMTSSARSIVGADDVNSSQRSGCYPPWS
ncbi:MAG: dihydroxyacetone kinase subunit DhaK [Blautia wexlerae]